MSSLTFTSTVRFDEGKYFHYTLNCFGNASLGKLLETRTQHLCSENFKSINSYWLPSCVPVKEGNTLKERQNKYINAYM